MSGEVGISIVIVAYRPGQELLDCIQSVEDRVTCTKEIVLVDNSPTPSPIIGEIAHRYPDVAVIPLPQNPGFSIANNRGAEASSLPFILFLNPDTRLLSEISGVEQLFDPMTGIVSGYSVDSSGAYKRTAGVFPTHPLRLFQLSKRLDQRQALRTGYFDTRRVLVDYTEGSLYLIRRSVFDQMGGFDEKIFLYGEDYELSYRVYRTGYKNYITNEIVYFHEGGFNHERESLIIAGLIYFSHKHLSCINNIAVRAVLATRTTIHLLLWVASKLTLRRPVRTLSAISRSLKKCVGRV